MSGPDLMAVQGRPRDAALSAANSAVLTEPAAFPVIKCSKLKQFANPTSSVLP